MAFKEIWIPFAVMLIPAAFLFPVVYLLDIVRQRIDPHGMRKFLLLFVTSYLLAMVVYILSISEDFLPFNSMFITYVLILLLTFVVYLIAFNRTKD